MNKLIRNITSVVATVSILSLTSCGKTSLQDVSASIEVNKGKEETNKQEIPKVKLDKENAISITTTEDYKNLVEMYNTERTKVKKDYIGKTLKVSGELIQVDKDKINNKIIVSIVAENRIEVIAAYFDFTEDIEIKLDSMKKRGHGVGRKQIGSSISVYGILTEFKESNGAYIPQLTNCEFDEA